MAYNCTRDPSSNIEIQIAAAPAAPNKIKLQPFHFFAKSVYSQKPTASPAKANAVHGNIGNNHTCGLPKICTPFRYDSTGHGKNRGRQVVQTAGVAIATTAAAAIAASKLHVRTAIPSPAAAAQHTTPIST